MNLRETHMNYDDFMFEINPVGQDNKKLVCFWA